MASPAEQLESMRRLQENWDGYGAAAPQSNVIDLALGFARLLETVFKKSSVGPRVLHLSPTRIGGVLPEWEDTFSEHEVEINPDQSISFLHMNKDNGEIHTRKFSPGVYTVIDPELLNELQQLLAA